MRRARSFAQALATVGAMVLPTLVALSCFKSPTSLAPFPCVQGECPSGLYCDGNDLCQVGGGDGGSTADSGYATNQTGCPGRSFTGFQNGYECSGGDEVSLWDNNMPLGTQQDCLTACESLMADDGAPAAGCYYINGVDAFGESEVDCLACASGVMLSDSSFASGYWAGSFVGGSCNERSVVDAGVDSGTICGFMVQGSACATCEATECCDELKTCAESNVCALCLEGMEFTQSCTEPLAGVHGCVAAKCASACPDAGAGDAGDDGGADGGGDAAEPACVTAGVCCSNLTTCCNSGNITPGAMNECEVVLSDNNQYSCYETLVGLQNDCPGDTAVDAGSPPCAGFATACPLGSANGVCSAEETCIPCNVANDCVVAYGESYTCADGSCVAGVCPPSCSEDAECQATCPAVAGVLNCCDALSSACFQSAAAFCPDEG